MAPTSARGQTERVYMPEQTEEIGKMRELRRLTDPRHITSRYRRLIFNTLFPPNLGVEPFNSKSTSQMRHSQFREGINRENNSVWSEYQAWRDLIDISGFKSINKEGVIPGDNPFLNVGFTDNNETLTYWLNASPIATEQKDHGQTHPNVETEYIYGNRVKFSRLDHAQEMAHQVTLTNFRLAIKSPQLYLERVLTDIRRYTGLAEIFLPVQPDPVRKKMPAAIDFSPHQETIETVDRIIGNHLQNHPDHEILRTATIYAAEYNKYLVIAAYLHDYYTPAWGDTFMKTRARHPQQKAAGYSEDAELQKNIWHDVTVRSNTMLPEIANKFHLDPLLLATMVSSLASEGDSCLPGLLLKDKKKFSQNGNTLEMAPWLAHIENMASFDLDQQSGTRVNAAALAEKYLPGGMTRPTPEKKPIGSFNERLRLLAYGMFTEKTKPEIASIAAAAGIDPQSLSLTAEEFTFGPNVTLYPVHLGQGREIMPVALDPGDYKRLDLIFNFLQTSYYRSPSWSTVEAVIRDCIACSLFDSSPENTEGNIYPQAQITSNTFLNRSDTGADAQLWRIAPVIPYLMSLRQQADTITAGELQDTLRYTTNGDRYYLISPADTGHMVNQKPGTLVLDDMARLHFGINLTGWRRGSRIPNPISTPHRLANLEARLDAGGFYHFIPLEPDQAQQLADYISQNPHMTGTLKRALGHWTANMVIDNQDFRNPLRDLLEIDG